MKNYHVLTTGHPDVELLELKEFGKIAQQRLKAEGRDLFVYFLQNGSELPAFVKINKSHFTAYTETEFKAMVLAKRGSFIANEYRKAVNI